MTMRNRPLPPLAGVVRTLRGWVDVDRHAPMMLSIIDRPTADRKNPTPEWANSDAMFRRLLVMFMEERARIKSPDVNHGYRRRLAAANAAVLGDHPRMVDTLDRLCREYVSIKRLGLDPGSTDAQWNEARRQPFMPGYEGEARFEAERVRLRALELQIEAMDTYLRYTARGGADTVAAAAYLYYRVGMDSVAVGRALRLKAGHVRKLLSRLNDTWRRRKAQITRGLKRGQQQARAGRRRAIATAPMFT